MEKSKKIYSIAILATIIGCSSPQTISSGPFHEQVFEALRVPSQIANVLILPSGKANPKNYSATVAEQSEFRKKLEKSKLIYEESGGEDVAGSLYGAMAEKLENNSQASGSAIYLVNREELAAMVDYSNERYLTINAGLRGDLENLKKSEIWIRLIMSGLNKLPNYQGIVYRGIGWGKDQVDLKKYSDLYSSTQIHSEMNDPAFLSSTTNVESHFVTCTPFVYKIHSKEGKKFNDFSTRPDEAEVLFRPLTQFQILKKEIRNIDTSHCSFKPTYKQQYIIEIQELN